jgi:hypothetical protein
MKLALNLSDWFSVRAFHCMRIKMHEPMVKSWERLYIYTTTQKEKNEEKNKEDKYLVLSLSKQFGRTTKALSLYVFFF